MLRRGGGSGRQGRRSQKGPLYQYYAQVTYNTCERCLRRHGEIFADPAQAPPIHPGCRCSHLELPEGELDYYREKGERMRAKADLELHRRVLFQRAKGLLTGGEGNPEEALALFERAAAIEVYIEEVERLCQEDLAVLRRERKLAERLKKIFIWGYRDTLQKSKYEKMPEGMKWARERWGVQRLEELFDELTTG